MTDFLNLLIWATMLGFAFYAFGRTRGHDLAPARSYTPDDSFHADSEQAHLIREVFMRAGHPLMARQKFDEVYRGTYVVWRGTVRKNWRGQLDIVVGETPHPQLGRQYVHVRTGVSQAFEVGTELTITGVADSIDFFGRTIAIADASVTEAF